MNDFDVIVIGAGPAGCYAALAAATKGLRVAIFEEHRVIGWPRHCPGWLMESQFAKSIIGTMGKALPWHKAKEYRVCHSESGELIETSTVAGYLVRRDLLEKEIAALAIRNGAKLYLGTKVVRMVRKENSVTGVETNSDVIPVANGQIIICADGVRSSDTGFAVNEGLCDRGVLLPGISHILANADVSGGIIEHFLSSEPLLNNRTFFTHRDDACFFTATSHAAFQEFKKRDDNAISRRIKNAYAVEVSGYARARSGKYAKYFKKIVKDNVMFIGDASGGAGNIHGMIQGHFAGTVAASAIREKDISEGRLLEYQDLVFNTLAKAPFYWLSAREDFGSFSRWLLEFREATKGIEATELAGLK